jgi:hypothetical protein
LRSAWKERNKIYAELLSEEFSPLPRSYTTPDIPEPEFKENSGYRQLTSSMAEQRIPILAHPPTETRNHWVYITSGLSNPWFQEKPEEVSGFGCELMIKSSKKSLWPIRQLKRLCAYLLSYSGTLSPGLILEMKSPYAGSNPSLLTNMVVWYADEAPDCLYELPSGIFGIFCAIGITEDEARYAEGSGEYGTWCVQQVLRNTGIGQLSDEARQSVMSMDGINAILSGVRRYAENFREMAGPQSG